MERVTLLIEDSGKQLSCMLNPERVVLRRSSGLVRQRSVGAELDGATDDLVLRTGGGSTEVELDLLFDLCLGLGDASPPVEDVRELTRALWRSSERSESGCRAATARLIWGRCWNMRVVVDALAERLEEFSPVGAARRSWLRVRLLRIEEEPPRSLDDVQDELPSVEGDAALGPDADALEADDLGMPVDANVEVVGVEALQEQAALDSGLWDLALELQREAEADAASEALEASEGELDESELGQGELDEGEPREVTDDADGAIDADAADAAHATALEIEEAIGEDAIGDAGEVGEAADGGAMSVSSEDAAGTGSEATNGTDEAAQSSAGILDGADLGDGAPAPPAATLDIAMTLRFAEPRAIASCLLVVIGQAYADEGRLTPAPGARAALAAPPSSPPAAFAGPAAAGAGTTPAAIPTAAAAPTPARASAPASSAAPSFAPAAVAAAPARARVANPGAAPVPAAPSSAAPAQSAPPRTPPAAAPAEPPRTPPAAAPAPARASTSARVAGTGAAAPAPAATPAVPPPTPTAAVPAPPGAPTPIARVAPSPGGPTPAPSSPVRMTESRSQPPPARMAAPSTPAAQASPAAPPAKVATPLATTPATMAAAGPARAGRSRAGSAPVSRRVIASEREIWDGLRRYGDRLEHLAVDTVESARLSLQRALRTAQRSGTGDLSVLERCVSSLCTSEDAPGLECPERELDELRHTIARLWALGERERARRLAACVTQLDRCAQQMRAALHALEEEPGLVLWRDACHALTAPGSHGSSIAQPALPAAHETRPLLAVYRLARLDSELPHAMRSLIQVLLDERASPDAHRAARAAACELSRREYERRLRSRRRSVFDPRTLDTARLRARRLDLVAQQRFGNPGEWRRLARARAGSESEPA